MIGNHVYGNHRTEGSNPSLCAIKKQDTRMGVLFFIAERGIRSRPLRKRSGGAFLGRSVYERYSSATRPKVRDESSRIDEYTLSAPIAKQLERGIRRRPVQNIVVSLRPKSGLVTLLILHSAFAPLIRRRRRSQRYR